ncbi:MAG: MATE family efflux transporter [Defluviitaleaceae bacterium]|nr:MATE family efflux transporter [Defluviitaleaceae bacterium]
MKTITKENRTFIKTIGRLAPPIVLQEILNALVNIISTIMIGRAIGAYHSIAIGVANQIFMSYSLVMVGIVGGCSVFIGQYYGKGERDNILKIMGIGFAVIISTTFLFFIFTLFFPSRIIRIFTRESEAIYLGTNYIRIVSFSYFLFSITFLRNSAMRAMGFTKVPFITTCITLSISFLFHYILIFVFFVDFYILAFIPIVARTVEIFVQEIYIRKYKIPIKGTIKQYFNFDKGYVKNFFRISIFIILNMIVRSLVASSYTISYGFLDRDSQSAIQMANAVLQIIQIIGGSIGMTTGVIIANTLGRGNIELAKRYARKSLLFASFIGLFVSVTFALLAPYIASFYMVNSQIEKTYIIRIIYVASFGFIFRVCAFVNVIGTLRSGGDTRFCFLLVLFTGLFVGLPLSFASAIFWGWPVYMVVACMYAEEIAKFIISYIRVRTNKWANRIV